VLFAAQEKGTSLNELFASLPKRFSRSALLKQFPRPLALRIVAKYSPVDTRIQEVLFAGARVSLLDENQAEVEPSQTQVRHMEAIRAQLESFFTPEMDFGPIVRLNYTDGVRIVFDNGDVAHFRPSGNADELRIYAMADTQARANAIAEMAVAEPDGILRMMENRVVST
jgi:phosphomannomutase